MEVKLELRRAVKCFEAETETAIVWTIPQRVEAVLRQNVVALLFQVAITDTL